MGARFINFAPIYRSVLDDDWFFEHGIDLNWNSPIETSRDDATRLEFSPTGRVEICFISFWNEVLFFLIIGIKKIRETKPCRLRKKILVFIILLGKVKTEGVGNEHLRGASPIWSQKNLRRGFRDFGSENRSFLKQMKLSGMIFRILWRKHRLANFPTVPLRTFFELIHRVGASRRGIFEPASARKRRRERETETGPHKFLDIGAVEIRSIEINSDAWHRREPVETPRLRAPSGNIARVGARRAEPGRAGPSRGNHRPSKKKKCNSKRSK